MRIGIDISGVSWKYRTGVQSLFYGLVEGLAELDWSGDGIEFALIDHSARDAAARLAGMEKRFEFRSPSYPPLFKFPAVLAAKPWLRPLRAWNTIASVVQYRVANRRAALERLLADLDVFHVWNWDIRTAGSARHVITYPDVIPLLFPELFPADFVAGVKKSLVFGREQADHIIAISEYTKNELVTVGEIPPEKITVLYPGVRPIFHKMKDEGCIQQTLHRYGLADRPYLLSIGYIDPRKNIKGHVAAFERLAGDPAFKDFLLVFVGPASLSTEQVLKDIRSTSVRERVKITGFVPDDDLVALANGASAFVFCSLYEGFGFPVLEAMSCGVPVVTSNTTSLAEIGRGAAVLVDPADPSAIAEGVRQVIMDAPLRSDLIARGLKHASNYTWANYARGHIKIYQSKN